MKPPSIVIDHFLSTKWSKKLFTINHYELQNGKCIVTQELSAYIQKAVEGDIVSINKVLKHYEGYISCLAVRRMYDKYGNEYYCIDENLRSSLEAKLIKTILGFKLVRKK